MLHTGAVAIGVALRVTLRQTVSLCDRHGRPKWLIPATGLNGRSYGR